jgi:uncharacterized protein (DUF362 family)/Pyruvate/2-oxoacid:ferredoxin oxidoreductase delta subunit
MKTTPVSLHAASSYDPDSLTANLRSLLAPLGGMEAFVHPGDRVLLKPNLLSGKAPEKAVTTHPEIVRAIIHLVQEAGGVVKVGDSPGIGKPEAVAKKCGIWEVIETSGVEFAPFCEFVNVAAGSGTFQHLELARDILDTDVVINLPKLKTHQMMGLTCGVKNLFGAVVGLRKPQLHLQAGTSKATFALMLLELAAHIRPALTIVDAIIGMEGDGPGSGDPIQIGALIAGIEPLAVDTIACELLGVSPDAVWTQKIARERGLFGSVREEIELFGPPPEQLRPPRFTPAHSSDLNFSLPGFLKRPLRRSLTARPVVDNRRCQVCGICIEACPPHAMRIDAHGLQIDEHVCIRCFCCQELCPHAALHTRQGLLLRLAQFLNPPRRS